MGIIYSKEGGTGKTSFGSLALLIALIIIIRIFFKRRTKQKLILEIGARAEVKVNSDIKI
ncbi:MAG: hypothetical protein DSZ21_00465 [Tenericutes bacterium]|nr:MAG: hypothetical protein DSZ21_00465 [Mycoplasmatota bacterium]